MREPPKLKTVTIVAPGPLSPLSYSSGARGAKWSALVVSPSLMWGKMTPGTVLQHRKPRHVNVHMMASPDINSKITSMPSIELPEGDEESTLEV